MGQRRTRSPLAHARGLGSAKDGVEAWWLERVTAIALVPLTLWLTASLMAVSGRDHAAVIAWLRNPLAALLLVLLLLALFVHLAFGLKVVIEDYVHSRVKIPALIAARLGCVVLCVAGILATLRVLFSG
jgi:succinate dehydrogenase / fumarate reductase, membrane anchor subunit